MKDFDVAFFAASVDDPETNKKFAESLGVSYPILSDPQKETARAFGVLNDTGNFARRWTFYIDRNGTVVKIDKEVSPGSSGQDVVSNLKQLGF